MGANLPAHPALPAVPWPQIKAQEDVLRQQLADMRAKEAEQGSDIPGLIQERDECRCVGTLLDPGGSGAGARELSRRVHNACTRPSFLSSSTSVPYPCLCPPNSPPACREICKAAYQKIQDLRGELDGQWAAYKEQNALFRVQLQEDRKKRQEDYLKQKAERDAERAGARALQGNRAWGTGAKGPFLRGAGSWLRVGVHLHLVLFRAACAACRGN